MTGIAMAAASGRAQPLVAFNSWGGSNPYLVAGATGVSSAHFSYSATGGVLPYSFASSILTNPSGKLDVSAVSDSTGPGTFDAIWNGFTLSETENAFFRITVTDNVGSTAHLDVFLNVQRTS